MQNIIFNVIFFIVVYLKFVSDFKKVDEKLLEFLFQLYKSDLIVKVLGLLVLNYYGN